MARPLRRGAGTTLQQQIIDDLLRRIDAGEFGPESRLPSEYELVDYYSVSRATVREVYRKLIDVGRVVAIGRQGYFVRPEQTVILRVGAHPAGSPLSDDWETAATSSPARTTVRVRVLGGPDDPVPSEVARRLHLEPESLVVLRDRICYIGGIPYMLRPAWFPAQIAQGTIIMSPTEAPAGTSLLASIGHPPASAEDYLRARYATSDEARLLELPRPSAVLDWVRTYLGEDSAPLCVTQAVLPGDRIALAGNLG